MIKVLHGFDTERRITVSASITLENKKYLESPECLEKLRFSSISHFCVCVCGGELISLLNSTFMS